MGAGTGWAGWAMLKLSRRERACDVSSKRWTPGAAAAASSIARADLTKIDLEILVFTV
jgi:hypothetical protein